MAKNCNNKCVLIQLMLEKLHKNEKIINRNTKMRFNKKFNKLLVSHYILKDKSSNQRQKSASWIIYKEHR